MAISANRKLLEDIQFRIKKIEFGTLDPGGTAKSFENMKGKAEKNDAKE